MNANPKQFELIPLIKRFWSGYKWVVYTFFVFQLIKFISRGIQYPFSSFNDFLTKLVLILGFWFLPMVFLTIIIGGVWCLVGYIKYKI